MNDKVYTSYRFTPPYGSGPTFTMFIHDPKKVYMRVQPNGLCRLYCYSELIRTGHQIDPMLGELVEFSRFVRKSERL